MPTCVHCGAVLAPRARHCLSCGVTLTFGPQATLPGPGFHQGPVVTDAMIGRSVIGQFVVRAKLGEGGMGAVYLADQPSVGRSAVIKVIHPWLSKDPTIAAAFAAEARAAARLQNPHIVSIYNYGTLPDGTLFIAMEYLEGTTLEDLVRTQGRLEPSRAVAFATQVCEALAEAHRKGVVHRDLKPSNIMVVSRGQGPRFIKVLDFGLAKIDGRDTASGSIGGTPPYMSPEQLSNRPVDGRSDVYSLACILYEMLAGRPPFVARSPGAYITLHASEPPPPISQVAPGVWIPPALEACLMRALAKDPHQRPQRAEVFADELWAAMMGTVEGVHLPLPIVQAPPPSGRAVLLAITAALVLAAGLGSAAVWYLRDDPAATPSSTEPASTVTPPQPQPTPQPRPPDPPASDPSQDAARTALLARDVEHLETELQRIAVVRGVPPEEVDRAMDEHRTAIASPPAGVDADRFARERLVDLILKWHQRPTSEPGAGRSQMELEAMFLVMDSPLELDRRRRMLNALNDAAAVDPQRRAELRGTLLDWIDVHASAYVDDVDIRIEDDEDPAPTIEEDA